ncbi:uncharacterized protein LOC114317911 [Camellia sinensis]|uniref:uncharacterized protein LOC114317911 n=1 Tax=Camellia sinensis TaxID=4442 RepID=UPI001035D68E|nr:uncharacterized protein LOC114317911 [Camellia sinensis]
MKPPTFYGGIEPLKVETWLFEMKKLYEVFPCSETQKVLLATYTLKDEARRWWLLIRSGNENMTWAQFNAIFYDKYFPQCFRDRKVSEFQELKQGRMSVAEALMAEATIAAKKQTTTPTTEWRGKRTEFSFKKGRSGLKRQNTGSSSSSSQSSGSTPNCPDCGKKHRGACYRASGTCFRCGKTGHMVRDCLMRFNEVNHPMTSSTGSVSAARPNARTDVRGNANNETLKQGRVFALAPGDVPNTYTVVSGK